MNQTNTGQNTDNETQGLLCCRCGNCAAVFIDEHGPVLIAEDYKEWLHGDCPGANVV